MRRIAIALLLTFALWNVVLLTVNTGVLPVSAQSPLLFDDITPFYDRARSVLPGQQIIWPFDERSGTAARAVTGLQANILANPGFEVAGGGGADTIASWSETAGTGGAITLTSTAGEFRTGYAAKLARGTSNIALTQDMTVAPGTVIAYSIWSRGDGTNISRFYIYDATNSAFIVETTNITASATYAQASGTFTVPTGCVTLRLALLGAVANGSTVYFDDCQLLAPTGLGTPFAATYSGVTLAQPGGPDGRIWISSDGVNDFTSQGNPATINAFSGVNGGIVIPILPTASSWTDGSADYYWYWAADANNYVAIYKSTTNNQLVWEYKAGGTLEQITSVAYGGRTTPIIVGLTWDKANDTVAAYADGALVGTSNSLGVWAGYLAATTTCLGSVSSSSPATVANGKYGPPVAWMGYTPTAAQMGYTGRGN